MPRARETRSRCLRPLPKPLLSVSPHCPLFYAPCSRFASHPTGTLRPSTSRPHQAAAKDLADRENRVLREAKTSLETENEQLRRRADTTAAELATLLKEHTATVAEKTKEVSELRADLKMKVFELTALGASFEERMSQLRQVRRVWCVCGCVYKTGG